MARNSDDQAQISEFCEEASEILQVLNTDLSRLEREGFKKELIDSIYRGFHTLKGGAQLIGLQSMSSLTHTLESCLEPIRTQSGMLNSIQIELLHAAIGDLESLVESLRLGVVDQIDFTLRICQLAEAFVEPSAPAFLDRGDSWKIAEELHDHNAKSSLDSHRKEVLSMVHDVKSGVIKKPAPSDPSSLHSINSSADEVGLRKESLGEPSENASIRVNVGILDKLMNLVGELVLVRNQVLQYNQRHEDLELIQLTQRMDLVTSELQDQVMRTRMQPIGNVLSKFQRLVRDLAKDLGKSIDLKLVGSETELDRTLLESIKDPLTHVVRNSCDHGVEMPEERLAKGKPGSGSIQISSFHEGGQVVIEITDDGKGLDPEKIKKKAIEKGIISETKGEELTAKEAINLIFRPGFSTAATVTDVSGRGVGMDVVKTNIEKIGGTVLVESEPHRGMTLQIKIPLTLAIVPALIIRSGGQNFAIPQVKLSELVRVEEGERGEKIECIQGAMIYRLRGKLLPLVDLRQTLGLSLKEAGQAQPSEVNIVVLQADGLHFGLIVDEVRDTADIVVKPLNRILKSLNLFSGATIMGDGSVSLILDVAGIAKRANIFGLENNSGQQDLLRKEDEAKSRLLESQDYLTFSLSKSGKMAIPLCLVNRLEEFSTDQVQNSGEQQVVPYRGSTLPLLNLNKELGFEPVNSSNLPVVVIQKLGRLFGVVVNEILDITSLSAEVDMGVRDRDLILGTLLDEDEIITVVDILAFVDKVARRMGLVPDAGEGVESSQKGGRPLKILYAEDSPFFRKQVKKILLGAGYQVEDVENGKLAYDKLRTGESYDLLLTDIEMPEMTGFELAKSLNEISSSIPKIALTTRFSQSDLDSGNRLGFDGYLEKLDGDKLLAEIAGIAKRMARAS